MATRRTHDPTRQPPKSERGASGAGTASSRPTRRRSGSSASKRPGEVPDPVVTSDARRAMIAEAAYLRAERRGFVPGFEEEDWLDAEKDVDALLSARHSGRQ